MGFAGVVSFGRDLQRRDPRLIAMAASLTTPDSPAGATYFRRTAAFAHQGVDGGYADWRRPCRIDPDCMVVADATLTDRAWLEYKLYGTRRPLAATADVVRDAYRQWGANLTRHLRGGFSLAIWDAVLQRVLLIRDPLGTKTIFFVNHAGGLAFATEATALPAHSAVSPSVEYGGHNEAIGIRTNRSPSCGVLRDVHEVLAGEIVQVIPESISRGRY